MGRPFLILDGYNVMHAAGFMARQDANWELQKARAAFLRVMAERLTSAERQRTHVIFDARNAPEFLSRVQRLQAITVEFADSDGDADEFIESLIRDHSAPRHVRVVSSDHRIQRAARRRRCHFVDSDIWWRRLIRRKAAAGAAGSANHEEAVKFGAPMSPAELARWMYEFRDTRTEFDDRSSGADSGIEPRT